MLTGDDGQAYDGVFVDTDQACRLSHATTLVQMGEDRDGLILGEFAVEQWGAFAFREAVLAGTAGQHPALLGRAIVEADAQVVEVAVAVVWAVGVLTTELFQVVHRVSSQSKARENVDDQLESS